MSKKWQKMPVREGIFGRSGGNQILEGKGFYISYKRKPRHDIFEDLNTLFTGDDKMGAETALHSHRHNGKWYILWGDWRKDYEKLVDQGFQACLAFYKEKKPEHGCDKWSTG